MNARLMSLLAAAVAIVAIGVGCGGSDDPNSGSEATETIATSSLSKAAFIKQAREACLREGKGLIGEATAYRREHESEDLPEGVQLANMVKAVILPTVEAQIAAVRELGAPAGDEKEIEALLAAQQAAVDTVRELKSAESLEVVESRFAGAAKKLEAYGFTGCAIA